MSFTFGKNFRVTVFGESHGDSIGVVVEGSPSGMKIDLSFIQRELDRRKPGGVFTSRRKERDRVEILSGIYNGKTTGAPITMRIKNEDIDSEPYDMIKDTPRPGHADLTAHYKYGFYDHRGGGIFSGRVTAAIVMAGALAKEILLQNEIKILAHIIQIGDIRVSKEISDEEIERNVPISNVNCADLDVSKRMEEEVLRAKKDGDSVGGIVECRVIGVPIGIGDPIFDSIESVLSHMIFSIPGVKGIEFGSGFSSASMKGSQHNDPFFIRNGKILTLTNNSGGILGGISNGMPIVFRVAMKPTSIIMKKQRTVNIKKMEECEIYLRGRHDPCIAIRAVPVIENAASIVIADLIWDKIYKSL